MSVNEQDTYLLQFSSHFKMHTMSKWERVQQIIIMSDLYSNYKQTCTSQHTHENGLAQNYKSSPLKWHVDSETRAEH